MAHHNTILAQLLRLASRHEFEALARHFCKGRRLHSMTRWAQFVALGQSFLGGVACATLWPAWWRSLGGFAIWRRADGEAIASHCSVAAYYLECAGQVRCARRLVSRHPAADALARAGFAHLAKPHCDLVVAWPRDLR